MALAANDLSFQARPIVGNGAAIRETKRLVEQAARTDATVLVLGESGTGKELVVRNIHAKSRRRTGPFVSINMAAVPEELAESEFFGHEKGAFSGAHQEKPGLFEVADAGVLFLDEIGDVPLPLQAKLLRAIQEREVRRVGGTRDRRFDVRIVAATHRDLDKLRRDGGFREDLFYRLNVISIHVPPLRQRPEDIPLLAAELLVRVVARILPGAAVPRLDKDALSVLASQRWPGNVRELENFLERGVALFGESLSSRDFRELLAGNAGETPLEEIAPSTLEPFHSQVRRFERKVIEHALELFDGSRSQAARALSLPLTTFRRKWCDLFGQGSDRDQERRPATENGSPGESA